MNGTDPHMNGTDAALSAARAHFNKYDKAWTFQLQSPQWKSYSPLAEIIFEKGFHLIWSGFLWPRN